MAAPRVGIPTDVIIPPPAQEIPEIEQLTQNIEWVGFAGGIQRTRIINDAFTT